MLKPIRSFLSIGAICLLALLPSTVHAADITVNSGCSLADAISAANIDVPSGGCPAGSGADTIALTGDVTLMAALPEIESEITIEGNGYTISGNESYSIFWVDESGTLAVYETTLADGIGADDDDYFDDDLIIGGAIVNWGNLTVSDSVFAANSADDWGGAIYNWGEASITGTKFTGNTVTEDGGAIANFGIANITDSTFSGNAADKGGAIYNRHDASVNIIDSTFTHNSADKGDLVVSFQGGAIFNNGHANISGSLFADNLSYVVGGAISNREVIIVTDSAFHNNSADRGGAIYSNGEASISDCTFTGNSANDGSGGAIYHDGEASIEDCMFTSNTASENGGAIVVRSNSDSTIVVSTFRENVATEDGGAIYTNGETAISQSNFIGNSAGDEGGAIRSREDTNVGVDSSVFLENAAEDGGAIHSWGELNVSRSTFAGNSAIEEGGGIANHGTATVIESILANNPGGDCHLGRNGEMVESGNNHIEDGTCGATWSGLIEDGYCPPGQERDGVCQIGAPEFAGESE